MYELGGKQYGQYVSSRVQFEELFGAEVRSRRRRVLKLSSEM
jgi:hypothetical protein